MAKIWPMYDGSHPTSGGPWADLPVAEAVSLFEIGQRDFVSDLTATPRFGDGERNFRWVGYQHVVVEIGPKEGTRAKLKPGFYKSRVTPEAAYEKLVRHALATELGDENIVRLEIAPTTDSQGENTLKVTVVILPGAVHKFKDGAVLDALINLNGRLREMGEERTPIIEYMTEAELQEVGGY